MTSKAQVHWYCGEHTNTDPFRALYNTASTEKENMICLNERVADLLMKIECMKGDSGNNDASKWIKAIACLEEEIKKLKAFYEAELSKSRRDVAIVTGEKSEIWASLEKCKGHTCFLQTKLDDEAKENQARRDEIAEYKCSLLKKEQEVNELDKYSQCLKAELGITKPRLEKYEVEAAECRQQLDCERRLRQDAEDKLEQLTTKLNFDTRLHEQQARDLNDRLKHAQELIEALNARIRDSQSKSSTSNPSALLQKIREQMLAEYEKYRTETELLVNRTIKEMKDKLDQRQRELQQLLEEKDRMEDIIGKIQGQNNQIQSQLASAIQSNQQLQIAIQNERLAAAQRQREMETHLRDSQDCLMQKVKEVTAARNVQAGLNAEIESLKTIIEIEESKYNGCEPPQSQCGNTGLLYATQGYPNRNIGCRNGANKVTGNRNLIGEGNRPKTSSAGQLPHQMKRSDVLTTLSNCS